MARTKPLTRQAVRDWVGDHEIGKGRPYATGSAISAAARVGNDLKANVQGTRDRPYRVRVTLDDGEVSSADCSCPVGDGGRCKHVAAVLLAYLDDPERFTEVADLDANLQQRDKAELVALIKLMVRRAPELEPLLAAPVPGFGKGVKVTPEVYRRQALDVIRGMNPYDEWAGDEIAEGLGELLEAGETFEQAEDFAAAEAVFQGVTAAVVSEGIDYLGDEVTGQLAAGLLRAFDRTPADTPRRESVLRSLFELLMIGSHLGYEDGVDQLDTLLDVVTPAERRTLAKWVRHDGGGKGTGFGTDYRARRVAELLLRIEDDVMDDEAYLAHCRRFGMREELLAKLIELGRPAEAVAEVAAITSNHDFLSFCEFLVRHGLATEAEQLMRARPKWEKEAHYVRWLKKRAIDRKDGPEVARLSELLLGLWPSLEEYRDIRKWIGDAEWPAKREKLLRQLEKAKSFGLLTDIYLHEKLIDDAIRVLRLDRYSGRQLQVAKAAEATRPEVAIEIYRKKGEQIVEGRHREAYREACQHFKKVAELMARQGQAAEFQTYIKGIAEKYKALRAFQEELRTAKLIAEVPPSAVVKKPTRRG